MSAIAVVSEAPPVKTLNWHDIEPMLKWVGVAYVFGFLIVMLYTYQLGIPTLQLIEPVNVWIGAPLAIVAYFLDKVYLLVKRDIEELRQSLRDAALMSLQPEAGKTDMLSLLQQIYSEWTASLSYIAVPFGGAPLRSVVQYGFRTYFRIMNHYYGAKLANTHLEDADRQTILTNVAPILRWTRRVAAFVQFLVIPYIVVLLLGMYAGYTQVFPLIPQTIAGGKPMSVTLMISRDSLPDESEFASWKRSTSSPPAAEQKDALLVPVTLYLRTEHEFFVRKGDGPIVSLSDHAVEGIVFPR